MVEDLLATLNPLDTFNCNIFGPYNLMPDPNYPEFAQVQKMKEYIEQLQN